jgi:hypothetical protein
MVLQSGIDQNLADLNQARNKILSSENHKLVNFIWIERIAKNNYRVFYV